MIIVRTFREVSDLVRGRVALVPTMGYLHEGHLSLIERASVASDTTVVSLFVNPTQFGDVSDLDTYPADEERDARLAEKAGADVLFAPVVSEVYPDHAPVSVAVGSVGEALEGVFRPGHFEGVATVVAKLLAGTRPDIALFGRKDAQQLAVIRQMASGLRFPTEIAGLPTVRESDGLALSSRNKRLDRDQRQTATYLSRALFNAADLIDSGVRASDEVIGAVEQSLAGVAGLDVEYVAVADAASATVVPVIEAESFVAVAAWVGGVRLIDNIFIDETDYSVDRGVRLDNPSILYQED